MLNSVGVVPGPGTYNIHRGLGRTSYSFGLKTGSSLAGLKNAPGPGAYTLAGTFSSIPGSKIGTSTRDDDLKKAMKQSFPGPAGYNIRSTISKHAIVKSSPSYGFGTQTRSHSASHLNVPGPGSYGHKEMIGCEG